MLNWIKAKIEELKSQKAKEEELKSQKAKEEQEAENV